MGTNHFRHMAVIVCVALSCVFSGCVPKDNGSHPGPPPRATRAGYATELEQQLAKDYTTTTDDGTHWKAFVTQVHDYNTRFYGVVIFGPPDSEWEMGLLRYDEATNDWEKSKTKIIDEGEEVYSEPDTARAAKEWNVPKEKLDAWVKEAETTMRKKMGQY